MVKNRLIFALLLDNGIYNLSRNFSLQAAGDLHWVKDFYSFDSISHSIDELIVLNVARQSKNLPRFAENLKELSHNCFMPIAAGGGIRSLEDAALLMGAGADKLVVNTPLFCQPELVRELVNLYGSQCVVASLDYRTLNSGAEVFVENGTKAAGISVERAVGLAEGLGVGEIFLTSITRDGTGQGYDLPLLKKVVEQAKVPVIAAGGVGTFEHLAEGIQAAGASASATANLFNFMADGLTEARKHLIDRGIPLAVW